MSSFWDVNDDGSLDVGAGAEITSTIAEAIELAGEQESTVTFTFNDVTVIVAADSQSELIYRDWNRAMNGYIPSPIGPYPNPELTDEERASDARIKAEHDAERERADAQYRAEAEAKAQDLQKRLQGAKPIELSNPARWQEFVQANNDDSYGRGIIDYAERWARLMQVELGKGSDVAEIAETASHLADIDGITGFMYGCAVSLLAECWKHGEELRQWHNLDTQIGHEGERANQTGGVLNPALLSLREIED